MRYTLLVCGLSAALLCLLSVPAGTEAKTVFRRRDKISEDFKQLNLAQEEIDPNVAPPEPQKVETLSPADVASAPSSGDADAVQEMTVDEAAGGAVAAAAEDAQLATADAANEISDATGDDVVEEEAVAVAVAPATTAAPVAAATTPAAADGGLSKYCKCSDSHCDCCRDIGIPLLPLRGPGCAKITYLGNERMSIAIRYGDLTLASRTISSKRARPVCVGLPGGYSQFCGRVYGLSKAKDNFKACLGFELRADDEVEAALRVSCFKFGPEGLRVAEAEPLPSEVIKQQEAEEEDDDDIFGFGAGGDDEDDDDEDYDDDAGETDDAADDEYADDDDDEEAAAAAAAADEAPEDADYGGFSLAGLLEELADDDDESSAKPPAAAAPVAAETPAVAATRTAVQSKDDKGSEAQAAPAAVAAADEAAETATTSTSSGGATKKKKKSKRNNKAKKNKKKKAANAEAVESSLAYQILNGILEYFN